MKINRTKTIAIDGTQTLVRPLNGNDFKLEELKKFVGGYVAIVRLPFSAMIMVVNEEGLLENLKPNYAATVLAGKVIVGNVLLCEVDEIE